ncbi:MAG: S-layer homology domain-containing protein [Candidatus Gracilibacteria bacterium]|nr:S-layer homology domain-containing protein [Candidatus Gracilibacteria bacterium]MDD3119950.1 S-layer homology domain-containing protein [Candidatus Gracilibacteria bacterium]MDD4530861.1 S-layer homology domain-containing protein [Candidatus Gracilibacteria bacterium]
MKKLFNLLLLVIFLVFDCDCSSYALDFSDTNEKPGWEVLADYGIINKQNSVSGYRLNDNALRQEAVIIALRLSGTSLPDSYSCKGYFKDVTNSKPNGWVCKVAEMASDQGIINKTSSKFRPEDKITRAEVLAIMMRVIKIDSSTTSSASSFSDVTIDWQVKLTNKALELGIIDGENLFYPNQDATRGEIFEITKRILLGNIGKDNASINGGLSIKDVEGGAMDIVCFIYNNKGIAISRNNGTAFLTKINGDMYVFTNKHVFEGTSDCIFGGYYKIKTSDALSWNSFSDFGAFKINNTNYFGYPNIIKGTKNVDELNYKISELPYCSNDMEVSTKVTTVGYPVYGSYQVSFDALGKSITKFTKIVTEGIISGMQNTESFDKNFKQVKGYPYDNYFVSNKIDSGNSGGPAFSYENGNLCLLGIVTWVSEGNFENQGVIQNINNIIYTGDY